MKHKKVEFEYIEVPQSSWAVRKTMGKVGEMGGLPIVHISGQGRQQTNAVLRSLGIQYGYYNPTDWKTCGMIDMICDCYSDAFNAIAKTLFMSDEERPAETEKIRDGVLRNFLTICEKQLDRSGKKFLVSDDLTIADFCLASFIFNILKNDIGPFKAAFNPLFLEFPLVGAYSHRLQTELAKHLNTREQKFF